MKNKNSQPPIKVFRSGPIRFSVWLNTITRDGKEVKSYAFKISRVFRDPNSGDWKTTSRFFMEDMPRVAMLAIKICSQFGIQTYEPETQSNEENDVPEDDFRGVVNSEEV